MKPDKHFIAALGIVAAAIGLIALTWVGTTGAIHAQRAENQARVNATLANHALTLSEQVSRQILGLDQTLRFLVTEWEEDPRPFDLEAWRNQAVVLNGVSRDMVLTDETGIIRQSTVPEAINQSAAGLSYFRALSEAPGDHLYIGPATIDSIMRQWHINVARPLHHPDGSFAGVIDADYRTAAITDAFNRADLGAEAFAAIAGLDDGRLRGAVGASIIDPDINIGGTAMFAAISAAESGLWIGPSANDGMQRIHAFRRIADRNLVVVVAMTLGDAMQPAAEWRWQAKVFAACITALLLGMAVILLQGTRSARRQEAAMAHDRKVLGASNAQLEVARALAAAKAEQLEVTLAGMTDGISMVDGQMRLVEWNARFPEISGVPADILRVGLPMEDMLRAQVRAGQFGHIPNEDAEIERRMARLRVAPYGVAQRQRPDGHTIELRRNRLPDGGFVTLYADITEHKRAEDALRAAQAAAEAANSEKSRFVAIVSHEIRTPLNALLNTVRLLAESVLTPAQRSLLGMAQQSGDALFGLLSDVLVMSQMEAGKLTIRPSVFELRPMLESCAEMFAAQAVQRGMSIHVEIADGTPTTLRTDPGRLRQVQLNLLSNAVKYAGGGKVWLTAEPGAGPNEAVRLAVRDEGPIIPADARERLFLPFSRLDRPAADTDGGTGLGLSICHHVIGLIGGHIGCDGWVDQDGREGNEFWVALPAVALPSWPGLQSEPDLPAHGQHRLIANKKYSPRTRILLTDDVVANQVVTATLLRREGHLVDLAGSGPEAIQALQTTPYDLVFMDIFMPGMSGQETTQIIRSLSEPACSTPIVALTANAGPEDEAIFKAAGMDGLLGKPVSIAELMAAVETHVWSHGSARNRHAGQSAAAEPGYSGPVLSAERLNELRDNLPPDTFAALMEECLNDMDHRLPGLRQALIAGAWDAVTSHAHALVGMAAGYGMAALEARLRAIMSAARAGDLARLGPSAISALDADYFEAARQMRRMFKRQIA